MARSRPATSSASGRTRPWWRGSRTRTRPASGEVARTAVSANELPPAPELIEQIAEVLGVEGAGYGYSGAAQPKRHHGGPMTFVMLSPRRDDDIALPRASIR